MPPLAAINHDRPRPAGRSGPATVARWTLGVALVSWRYLWATTPLRRTVDRGDATDLPPPVPAEVVDEGLQRVDTGSGPLYHRTFEVTIDDPTRSAGQLIATTAADLGCAMPAEVTTVDRLRGAPGDLVVGDELVVRLPGPWDGPVRVVDRRDTSFRLATMRGHLEAGQIEFRAAPDGDRLTFTIEAWARPSAALVNVLYTRLRMAREIQLNMWVRFCLRAAKLAGGHAREGVTVRTRILDTPELECVVHEPFSRGRDGYREGHSRREEPQ